MKQKSKKEDEKEIGEIKRMKAIEGIIKKSDIENAFVSTISRDSEAVSSDIADNIINRLNNEKIDERELTLIEHMTTERKAGGNAAAHARKDITPSARRVATRPAHLARKQKKPAKAARHAKKASKKSAAKRKR